MKNLLFLALLLTGIAAAQTDPLVGKTYSDITELPGYAAYKPAGFTVLRPVDEQGNFIYAISGYRSGTDAILILGRMVQGPDDPFVTCRVLRTLSFTLAQNEVIDFYDCYIDGQPGTALITVHTDFLQDKNPAATQAWRADPVKESIDPFTGLSRITCIPAEEEAQPMEMTEEEPQVAALLPAESLTLEEVKATLEQIVSDPKARRKWKKEQRKKRRN